ncbi:hypothetical protein GCM10009718_13750 [Isoptericola halotolerans]|uniref:Uncharacterized protein n=1 Tax=Isoptericola halotolerans TaxID=300560 RepID=A0ABX2A1F1_9MICO|nr:hypothetical protein [Isoptericola halotolerans]NOV95705.1 hypothetical protein [Isoptericola halotolerans]
MLLTTTDVAQAATHLRDARTALDDAVARLGHAALLDWRSPAGDACRAAVDELRLALATDAVTLDQAVGATDSCLLP